MRSKRGSGWALTLAAALAVAACAPQTLRVAGRQAVLPSLPAAAPVAATPPVPPSPSVRPSPPSVLGPGGLTLGQEVGAVIMAGFEGPPTPALLADWRSHQFGGLLVISGNGNGPPASLGSVIAAVRGVMRGRLIAATDQEGGGVCTLPGPAACASWAYQAGAGGPTAVAAQVHLMACALRRAGFDEDLGPVADVWDSVHPFMAYRSYGASPAAVAADVAAAVGAIHACGLLSAAKHFPGEGAAAGDPHLTAAISQESAATISARDWAPFRAAVGAGVDMVMVGHVLAPALDPSSPGSVSPVVISDLRGLGFHGVVISDDLQMAAIRSRYTLPQAVLRFLESGGDMAMVAHNLSDADAAYQAVMQAVLSGAYPRARLDASVARILALRAA
ncbi:MAG: glycoside hydrolase family 3 N-terminal domain-containing protein [Candidatus Dormibacterales bacterium]